MIKCKTCGKTISENNSSCPYCGDKIVKLSCPKCKSVDIGFDVKETSNKRWQGALVFFTFGLIGLFISKTKTDRVKYVCRSCGKKFKLK